jgi:3-dehydroquinate synthase
MIAAAAIARDVHACSAATAEQIEAAVRDYGPLPSIPCGADGVLNRLAADKKTVAGVVHFVLPQKIGKVKIVNDVPVEVIRAAVEQIRAHA